jgi:hypothetical protein
MCTLSRFSNFRVSLHSSHSHLKQVSVCSHNPENTKNPKPTTNRYHCTYIRGCHDRRTPIFAVPESDNAPSLASSNDTPSVALEGDLVTLHFTVFGEQGERLESSRDAGQPLTFEVGSSGAVGNELLQAFDGGVRGLAVGETKFITYRYLSDRTSVQCTCIRRERKSDDIPGFSSVLAKYTENDTGHVRIFGPRCLGAPNKPAGL